jgi:hypothetical protein
LPLFTELPNRGLPQTGLPAYGLLENVAAVKPKEGWAAIRGLM